MVLYFDQPCFECPEETKACHILKGDDVNTSICQRNLSTRASSTQYDYKGSSQFFFSSAPKMLPFMEKHCNDSLDKCPEV